MKWETVIEGIVAGIASTLTWVILLFLVNLFRNFIFEYKLKTGFSKVGYSFSDNAFGIIIQNVTNIPVNVWGVSFYFQNGGYAPLYFCGEKVASRKIKLSGFLKPRYRYNDFPPFKSYETNGAVSLEFDMSGTWEISKDRALSLSPLPDGAYCLLEYKTLLNNKKRTVVKVNRIGELQDAFNRFRNRWIDDSHN